MRGQDQVFFDVTQPLKPKFISANNPSTASITDEFAPLSTGGFLATFMGGPAGAHPGRVLEYDANLNVVQTLPTPTDDAEHPFNPHGISIDEAHNLMVTSDYVCPVSPLHVGGGLPHLHGSIRVWNLAKRSVTRYTVVGDHAGTMDVRLIPGDARHRAFTAGMNDNQSIWSIRSAGRQSSLTCPLRGVAVPAPPIWPQLLNINKAGTRLFATLNFAGQAGKVVMLDRIRSSSRSGCGAGRGGRGPGPNSGPHYLTITTYEDLLVVSDYFLVEDLVPSGVINAEGDMKIHVINVFSDHLELDTRFNLDFSHDVLTGPAHPHGLVVLPGRDG